MVGGLLRASADEAEGSGGEHQTGEQGKGDHRCREDAKVGKESHRRERNHEETGDVGGG